MTNHKQFTMQKSKTSASQNSEKSITNFVITKKIAKHGSQAVIVIPSILSEQLPPQTLVKLTIDILERNYETDKLKGGIE